MLFFVNLQKMNQLLTTASEIQAMCDAIYEQNHDKTPKLVGIDTEFIREATFAPIIELIQVSAPESIFLIDAAAFHDKPTELVPFLNLLQDPELIKVVHAAQGDQESIWMNFHTIMTPLFDTAVAASLCGLGDTIGLASLLQQTLDIKIQKGHARTNWSLRPLSETVLEYAKNDVKFLIEVALLLFKKLDEFGRKDLAFELSKKWCDPKVFDFPLAETAKRLLNRRSKSAQDLDLLMRLIAFRETLAKQLNAPRKWVLDDQTLVAICLAKPQDLAWLENLRGISRIIKPEHLEQILAIVGAPQPENLTPWNSKDPLDDSKIKLALSLFQIFLDTLCDNKQISSRQVISKKQMLELMTSDFASFETFCQTPLLHPNSMELLGAEIWDFLQGRSLLGLKNKQIGIFPKP
jgi:ribonuclease D